MTDSYYKGKPVEESRQQYATRRVQEYQAAFANDHPPLRFDGLLSAFVFAGREYDAGVRKVA